MTWLQGPVVLVPEVVKSGAARRKAVINTIGGPGDPPITTAPLIDLHHGQRMFDCSPGTDAHID
jgi:hypothetical protein